MTEFLQFASLGLGPGGAYTLLAVGIVVIFKGSGVLNVAHGSFAMVGAYVYYDVVSMGGRRPWLGVVAGVAAGAATGLATQVAVMRPL
jgi:branched-subunit amino acid ABC-type transport system permease component